MAAQYRVDPDGMGGFLDPPGYPTHSYSVVGPGEHMSLPAAAESDWVAPPIRQRARELLASWKKPPITSPEIRDWVHQVLGYFASSYQGEGGSWNASDLRTDREMDPLRNASRHAGVHFIRKFYPTYRPTRNDFRAAYWGSKKPTKSMKTRIVRKPRRSREASRPRNVLGGLK